MDPEEAVATSCRQNWEWEDDAGGPWGREKNQSPRSAKDQSWVSACEMRKADKREIPVHADHPVAHQVRIPALT